MKMNESIFGLFVTDERRLQYVKNLRSGVKHLNNLQPYAPGPQDTPVLTVTIESGKRIERVECVLSAPETAVFPLTPTAIDWDLLNWSYRQTWQCTLPAQPEGAFVRYQIWAYPADGSEPLPTDDGPTFSYLVDSTPLPDWAREARIYQIFPDRFSPGNGRSWNPTTSLNDIYGGTLRGVIDNLDYIAEHGLQLYLAQPLLPRQNPSRLPRHRPFQHQSAPGNPGRHERTRRKSPRQRYPLFTRFCGQSRRQRSPLFSGRPGE
jgi:cyclomaltodextrinase / maltogenic alpha-amylase / neopullulanase